METQKRNWLATTLIAAQAITVLYSGALAVKGLYQLGAEGGVIIQSKWESRGMERDLRELK